MIIKLVRHGESEANLKTYAQSTLPDHLVPLTTRGVQQAQQVGQILGRAYLKNSLIYTSPFLRARQTLMAILEGAEVSPAAVTVFEDPRLREVDHGYFNISAQQEMIKTYGHFYYRYQGGESAADCYDRVSSFFESFARMLQKTDSQQALIVTHGLALRVFVMRFLHLRVEQFDEIANPDNGDIVTLALKETLQEPFFTSGRWGVEGLNRYSSSNLSPSTDSNSN